MDGDLVTRVALVGSSSACALYAIATVRRATTNVSIPATTLVARAAVVCARGACTDGVVWVRKHACATCDRMHALADHFRYRRRGFTVLEALSDVVLAVVSTLAFEEATLLRKLRTAIVLLIGNETRRHTARLSTPDVADARAAPPTRMTKVLMKCMMI